MPLRTPRRRISPRAKRRCRAIKNFLRRALGTNSSQQDIQINSSIAINVTDLKHKIVNLEQQLTEANKHCRELVCFGSNSIKDSQTLVTTLDHDLSSLKEQTEPSSNYKVNHRRDETKLLYKTSESRYRNADDSDSVGKHCHDSKRKDVRTSDDMTNPKKSKLDNRFKYSEDVVHRNLGRHRARSTYDYCTSNYGANTSYHSLHKPRIDQCHYSNHPKHHYQEYLEQHDNNPNTRTRKQNRDKNRERCPEHYEGKHKRKRQRKIARELDEDFIADIIDRQYRPLKMFGNREMDMSQYSAPVCRDKEYSIRENILEGSELCSCCFDSRKKTRYECGYELSGKRSICDARLYSSKRENRHRYHRIRGDNCNDSYQYDLMPVKEQIIPKSRRNHTNDTFAPFEYKEVPPSPRTHRPRLNLRAQYYTEFEDYMLHKRHMKASPKRSLNDVEQSEIYTKGENKVKRNAQTPRRNQTENHIIHQNVGIMSNLRSPLFNNEPGNVTQGSFLNKTQEADLSIDKTDKALIEIKDILQSFLQEIKKESHVSQCGNSEANSKEMSGVKCSLNEFEQENVNTTPSMMPNNGLNISQCSTSPILQNFPNPYCYPALTVCPMNYMPNNYVMPNPSFTCASCTNNLKKDTYHKTDSPADSSNTNVENSSETDKLIKEIYKFVTQSPLNSCRKDYSERTNKLSLKDLNDGKITTRHTGATLKMSRQDAQVETQKIKCHAKSCEAIDSKFLCDMSYSRTNPSYSDTAVDKLNIETATCSASEMRSESTAAKQRKGNKLANVLRSFGFFKRKKDVIEELSESESSRTREVEIKPKKPPFRQEVVNYTMHGQEFFQHPPSPHFATDAYYDGCGCNAVCPDNSKHINAMRPQFHRCQSPTLDNLPLQAARYHSLRQPTAPLYPYEGPTHNQPQVPLCLKEVEVKSVGTQSRRKNNLFQKFTRRIQPSLYPTQQTIDAQHNCSTQTTQTVQPKVFGWKKMPLAKKQTVQLGKDKPAVWSWKALQAKVNQLDHPDQMGMAYSHNTNRKLAQGDNKMRNALLKKMFYKRNPFSPRNLIVRTLLGKDKSSYGDPPAIYRPRMFF